LFFLESGCSRPTLTGGPSIPEPSVVRTGQAVGSVVVPGDEGAAAAPWTVEVLDLEPTQFRSNHRAVIFLRISRLNGEQEWVPHYAREPMPTRRSTLTELEPDAVTATGPAEAKQMDAASGIPLVSRAVLVKRLDSAEYLAACRRIWRACAAARA